MRDSTMALALAKPTCTGVRLAYARGPKATKMRVDATKLKKGQYHCTD